MHRKQATVILVLLYWALIASFGKLMPEHIGTGALILVLSFTGPTALGVLAFLMPLFLTGIVYDSQRYYSDLIRGPVHVAEPYLFDKTFFGIRTAAGILTPNEWWQLHTHPLLDAVTGFFYIAFIPLFVLTAAYFRLRRDIDPRRALGMMWSFFWVNCLGYTTYFWYSAAPPWYVALHGLGPARMDTPPNPAGCARFDRLFGTHLFDNFYGKSADIFGAIPSLHVAYPLIALLYALRFRRARGWALAFYLAMCFSAVYLNHHYILDIIWGSVYAVFVTGIVDACFSRPLRAPLPEPLPLEPVENFR